MKNLKLFSFKVVDGLLSEILRELALAGYLVIAEYMEEATLITGSSKNCGWQSIAESCNTY